MEILVSLAVLAILLTMSVTTFRGLDEKYKVETETKQLYTDLMEARARASQRYRVVFVRLSGNGYTTYEDTNTAPDGNGTLETIGHPGGERGRAAPDRRETLRGRDGVRIRPELDRLLLGGQPPHVGRKQDYDCVTIKHTRSGWGLLGGACVEK